MRHRVLRGVLRRLLRTFGSRSRGCAGCTGVVRACFFGFAGCARHGFLFARVRAAAELFVTLAGCRCRRLVSRASGILLRGGLSACEGCYQSQQQNECAEAETFALQSETDAWGWMKLFHDCHCSCLCWMLLMPVSSATMSLYVFLQLL